MAAYCPHDPTWSDYRISLSELSSVLPVAARYWVAGFLAGNLPPAPVVDEDDPEFVLWRRKAELFAREGWWPRDDQLKIRDDL
jgi:hypothetical protein